MKIVTRKLDKNMNGPKEFAVLTEQELIELGYVWDYNVYSGGLCVRTGTSKIKDEAELREFIASGMTRFEWEDLHK
jgi:hypothetical protein